MTSSGRGEAARLPSGDYEVLLGELKDRVRAAQSQARRAVNTKLVELYWGHGAHDPRSPAATGLGLERDRAARDRLAA